MPNRVKLGRALICMDCETIYDCGEGFDCPNCTSRVVWPLGSWIKPCVQNLNTDHAALAANKPKEVV